MKGENHEDEGFTKYWNKKKKRERIRRVKFLRNCILCCYSPSNRDNYFLIPYLYKVSDSFSYFELFPGSVV